MFVDFVPDKATICALCKTERLCQWHASVKKFICQQCVRQRSYSAKNSTIKGKRQKQLPPFSVEFEVQYPSIEKVDRQEEGQLDQCLPLLRIGFIRTSDGTVSEELKSPQYCSTSAFFPALLAMGRLAHLVGEKCGTHLHVECQSKKDLGRVSGEVFAPLLGHLLDHPEETLVFWGRGWNDYALPHHGGGRYFAFNTQTNHPTLEFRLPRFRSKEQYVGVIRFARKAVHYLDRHLPLALSDPCSLPILGQRVLRLYKSCQPDPSSSTWFDALPAEQQKHLLETTTSSGWRRCL